MKAHAAAADPVVNMEDGYLGSFYRPQVTD